MFPLPETNDGKIVCYTLTRDFLIYGTDVRWNEIFLTKSVFLYQKGILNFFHIAEWQLVNKFDKHKTSIQKLFPENFGTSVAFIDQKGDGYLYNVVSFI
jgi:hypothetical protein